MTVESNIFANGETETDVLVTMVARDAGVSADTVRKVLTALYGGSLDFCRPTVNVQHALHVTYNSRRDAGRPEVERIELPEDVDRAGAAVNASVLMGMDHVDYVDLLHRGVVTVVGPWKAVPGDDEDEPRVCVDCGVNTAPCDAPPFTACSPEYGCDHAGTWEWYMVRDEVWALVGAPDVLCIGCLEKRLGRPLTGVDFSDAPINDPGPKDTVRLVAARSREG